MLVVETIAKIRRMHFSQGMGIKTICRELKLSKKVVRKVVRSGATEFSYKRRVQPRPKLGIWLGELDRLLAANAARGSRERLSLMQLYEELRGLGYEGGYDAVRRYASAWKQAQGSGTTAAFVPLTFAPGEAYQFDWSHEVVLINGVTVTVKVAHVRLCHSRMFFVRAYPRETQEMVFDAHDRAFAFFRGTCARGIYDSETLFAIGSRTMVERRRRWTRFLSGSNAPTTAGSSKCAAITSWIRLPAPRRRAGASHCAPLVQEQWRAGRSRARLALCANGSFHPDCA